MACGSAGKKSVCKSGDLGLIPGLGRSAGERKRYPIQYSGLENSMHCIVQGSHFRLPMRMADQSVYLTFHLCDANFCFFSKDSVPAHTQQRGFTCPATLGVFRLLGFLIVWEVCNPSFKVFSCNFTVWRSHHLFKSKFWCRACSFQFFLFYTQGSGCPITSSEQIPRVKMPD